MSGNATMKKIIIRHAVAWLLLSTAFFFLCEPMLRWLVPEVHDIDIWLKVLAWGLVVIFCLVLTSFLSAISRRNKSQAGSPHAR
jgi:uncharacterized protein involved in cysteine biosynthesis